MCALYSFAPFGLLSSSFFNNVGAVPAEVGLLLELKILSLKANTFTVSISQLPFGVLCLLSTLDSNRSMPMSYFLPLQGNLPAEIGSLSNLEYLDVEQNRFEGALPATLGNLADLEVRSFQTYIFLPLLYDPSESLNKLYICFVLRA